MLINPIWFRGGALVWMGVIFYLSSQSNLPVPPLFLGLDKVGHVIIYSILGACLAGGFCRHPVLHLKCLLGIAGLALLYGVTDEFHQSFVPDRSMSGLDLVADMVGGFVGASAIGLGIRWQWLRLVRADAKEAS